MEGTEGAAWVDKKGVSFPNITTICVISQAKEQNLNSVFFFFLLLLLRIDQKIVLPNFYNNLYLKTDI